MTFCKIKLAFLLSCGRQCHGVCWVVSHFQTGLTPYLEGRVHTKCRKKWDANLNILNSKVDEIMNTQCNVALNSFMVYGDFFSKYTDVPLADRRHSISLICLIAVYSGLKHITRAVCNLVYLNVIWKCYPEFYNVQLKLLQII